MRLGSKRLPGFCVLAALLTATPSTPPARADDARATPENFAQGRETRRMGHILSPRDRVDPVNRMLADRQTKWHVVH